VVLTKSSVSLFSTEKMGSGASVHTEAVKESVKAYESAVAARLEVYAQMGLEVDEYGMIKDTPDNRDTLLRRLTLRPGGGNPTWWDDMYPSLQVFYKQFLEGTEDSEPFPVNGERAAPIKITGPLPTVPEWGQRHLDSLAFAAEEEPFPVRGERAATIRIDGPITTVPEWGYQRADLQI
jgi:hypothetical protein